jgi:hypothetical protein
MTYYGARSTTENWSLKKCFKKISKIGKWLKKGRWKKRPIQKLEMGDDSI